MSFFFRQLSHGDALQYLHIYIASGIGIFLISIAVLCLVAWKHDANDDRTDN